MSLWVVGGVLVAMPMTTRTTGETIYNSLSTIADGKFRVIFFS